MPEEINRRDALKHTAMLGLTGSLIPNSSFGNKAYAQSEIIVKENQKPGSDDWQLTRVKPDANGYRIPMIEGYCSKQSVAAGETIDIMVSTNPVSKFKIEIFRTGYYGGKGARLVQELGPFEGKTQVTPEPGDKNVHECQWQPTTQITIPDDWVSGVYLGRLTTLPPAPDQPYWQSYIIFIVKDERPADILFQCSDNTWQAYNKWPSNYSIYTHPKGVQGPWAKVSFDRPYGRQSQFMDIVNDPLSFGSGEYLSFEQPFSYFLEEHGYDVTYCSNSDLLTPDRALKCKSFLSQGHDEYWDIRQFRSVEKLKESGVNLLFFSGNSICWVCPFSESSSHQPNRIIFRAGPYGGDQSHAVTREADHGPFPERGPDEGMLMGVRNIRPINGGGDWTIVNPDHWIFEGTGVVKGDYIPGLVGWEYHGNPPDIPGLEVVAEGYAWVGGKQDQFWSAVIYPGPKDNFVFNASTIFWAQGLSHPPGHTLPWSHFSRPHGPDRRVQQITHNLLNKAIQSQ
ncbi:N,N-dimethylformamidase beta subunit family domain-containing protein [Membranihabitans marinus]|uniref:N,N-dimethylformamidase beta subunit family domain-containing protein n=1 Tax=Membranihabitans marinus TaxID=1227546 RepID=UPI001F15A031|nr:N,N-dimethylformamidase beta subunit family domain-containing protein [Membranihabitans marinus]